MIRGTTPKQSFEFEPGVLDTLAKVIITYVQNDVVILEKVFTSDDFPVYREEDSIVYNLTQEETYLFDAVPYYIQIKVLDDYGGVMVTQIFRLPVLPVLNEDII